MEFSLPVTSPEVDSTDELPTLSVVVGSSSTARTTTYLTAGAVYTTGNLSSSAAENISTLYNDSVLFFKYLVAADDESLDLR